MREIKFRAKKVDNGEFVYGYLSGVDTIREYRGKYYDEVIVHQIDPKTIGQYIGFKDKNGVEIYKGDIMKDECELKERPCKRHTGVVMWEDYRWKIDLGFPSCDTVHTAESGVVIGNIHENPELIK